MRAVRELVAKLRTGDAAYQGPRCVGGCDSVVAARGNYCQPCAESQAAQMRAMYLADASASLPAWPWARFGAPDYERAVAKSGAVLAAAGKAWRRHNNNLVLLGPTGCGKTATVVAMAYRMVESAERATTSAKDLAFVAGLRFISAKDIATARREHKLGAGESPLEHSAQVATLLILDELGYEPQTDTAIPDIIDARYRAQLPIIVTCGLTEAELASRYGDATKRRLCQIGRVVSAHPQ
jgi:DNA replication protein DnaC